jgi:hypothetical protein
MVPVRAKSSLSWLTVKGRTKFDINKTLDALCLGGLGEFCSVLASSDTIDILRVTTLPEINNHIYSLYTREVDINGGLKNN